MRKLPLILPLVPLLLAAAAPDDVAMQDAQCLLALGHLGSSDDESTRQAGQIGSQYFFGRLDGRSVPDLEALLNEAAATMKVEDLEGTLQRCAALLQKRGQALQAIGERMNAKTTAE